jgi:hypothetical protein
VTWDYTQGMPTDTGLLQNDTLGNCPAAAKYHRLWVVVFRLTAKLLTSDQLTPLELRFYEGSIGYRPNDLDTDRGGNMQSICDYWVNVGMPLADNATERSITAFVADPSNAAAVAYVGQLCSGIEIDSQITSPVMPADGSSPPKARVCRRTTNTRRIRRVHPRPPAERNVTVGAWGSFYELSSAL